MKLFSIIFFSLTLYANNIINYNNEPIQAIQKDTTLDLKKVSLGEKLFFDPRLSKDGTISCSSCHNIENGGSDNRRFSIGVEEKVGITNSPSILNSSLNFFQFWDGRANSLEEQIEGPIHNSVEMATNWQSIIKKLNKIEDYKKDFQNVFNDKISSTNIKKAIVEYEKSLITPSRFDKYLKGNENILTKTEMEGYNLFKDYGCVSCHQGKNVGGNMFEKLGVFKPYDFENKKVNYGRYNITRKEENKFEFKVPSLRNVALTSPYLHDGSIDDLKKVISLMGKHQLGRDLSNNDINKIEAFLYSLTSEKLEKRNNAK